MAKNTEFLPVQPKSEVKRARMCNQMHQSPPFTTWRGPEFLTCWQKKNVKAFFSCLSMALSLSIGESNGWLDSSLQSYSSGPQIPNSWLTKCNCFIGWEERNQRAIFSRRPKVKLRSNWECVSLPGLISKICFPFLSLQLVNSQNCIHETLICTSLLARLSRNSLTASCSQLPTRWPPSVQQPVCRQWEHRLVL